MTPLNHTEKTMGNNEPSPQQNILLLIISLFALLTYLGLFFFRHFDDNRLTSWEWVFQGGDAAYLFLILVAGVILAFGLSRISVFPRIRVLFLFCLSFAFAGLMWGEPEVIVDTSRYFTAAKHLELYGIGYFIREWGRNISAWTDMPLIPFLYGLIFKFIGESRIYIQIFNTLLFSLSTLITYLIGKELWDEDTGFFGGMLLLGMPYLLTQVPLMLVDVPVMFFFLLSVFAFLRALKQGGWWIPLSAMAVFLSFYSKYSAWLMLSIMIVIFMIYLKNEQQEYGTRRLLYRAGAYFFLATILISAVFLYKSDIFIAQMKLLIEYQKPGLNRWGESFTSTFLFQVSPFISLAALYSVYAAARKKDWKYLIVLWLVLLVIVMQVKRIRYIIMIFPMLGLMASYGISRIKDKEIRKFIVSCILIFSFTIAFFGYLPFIEKMSAVNLKEAGSFIDAIPEQNIEIFTLLTKDAAANPAIAVPILDLFTNKKIIYNYNADISAVLEKKISKSSLRFTWEYKNPDYYKYVEYSKENTAVAVISSEPGDALLSDIQDRISGCRLSKIYDEYEDIFRFRTSVRVFQCGTSGDVRKNSNVFAHKKINHLKL
ncbi:MAG: hypothetical protein A2X59_05130 [Nitrospirae bacterium GWC2_42_7]|nr:MAG: hypothetical protein A2X59_05130 [Nitrospirae bacterium GWC2_42_7]